MHVYIHTLSMDSHIQTSKNVCPEKQYSGPGMFFFFSGGNLALKFFLEKLRIDSYLRPESYLGELGVDENLMSEEFWHTLREARFGRRRTFAILKMY